MNSHVLLALLMITTTTGSLMSMEKETSRLNFVLNNTYCIKGYSAEDMVYPRRPDQFVGKNIYNVMAFNEDGCKTLCEGFNKAASQNVTVKRYCKTNNAEFLTTITPIIRAHKKINYFLKVQEVDSQ